MNRILLFGADGQIGWRLAKLLGASHKVIRSNRSETDLSDPAALRSAIRRVKPDVIVNAAAYTAVDQAERQPALARAVNAIAPRAIAEEAAKLGSLFVHFSTDYIFDGRKLHSYAEEDIPAPLNIYGQTKLEGEELIRAAGGHHLIFRTSWIYDSRGRNFLLTMLRLAREREELRIVNDQTGTPNWAQSVAETVVGLFDRVLGQQDGVVLNGTYHLSAKGQATWFEFAQAIFAHPSVTRLARTPRLVAISTADYPTAAMRPGYSVLSAEKLEKTFGVSAPSWREGLDRCLQDLSDRPR
jgi:dTDP-4-dehydrorhamnose reductase